MIRNSILGAFAAGGHFDEFGVELAENGDEVALGGHDFVDVFVGLGDFVEAGGDEGDALLLEVALDVFPVEFGVGGGAAHGAAGTVGGGVQGFGVAQAADDEAGRGHGAGDDAKHACAGRGGAFAMHDDFAVHAVDDVALFPGKVVVVLDIQQDLRAEVFREVAVDAGVVGGGILAHEFHGLPIFLAGLGIEGEPGEAF